VKIISGKRMCRVLEQRGWTLARINGSHHVPSVMTSGHSTNCPMQPEEISV
jgi:predicted RNA binding protein YcfA (HicA-like mRNA interferase family)